MVGHRLGTNAEEAIGIRQNDDTRGGIDSDGMLVVLGSVSVFLEIVELSWEGKEKVRGEIIIIDTILIDVVIIVVILVRDLELCLCSASLRRRSWR